MSSKDPYRAETGIIPSSSCFTLNLMSHAAPSRFHNDGRMLDVFQRLTAKEGSYFTPQDLEVSIEELSYIVKKAEQWRGFNGERRKVRGLETMLCSSSLLKDKLSCFHNKRNRSKVSHPLDCACTGFVMGGPLLTRHRRLITSNRMKNQSSF